MTPVRLAKLAFILTLCLIMQACSAIYMTSALEDNVRQTGTHTCRGNAGDYFLPKAELEFLIKKVPTTGDGFRYEMKSETDSANDGPAVVFVADGKQEHCLEFLANPLYSDVIRVQRDGGLLQTIYSNVADQSKEIIQKAADGIATLAASRASMASRDFGLTSNAVDVMQMQFDPFDSVLLTEVNKSLELKGYCITLDPTNDPYVPGWMRNQCSAGQTFDLSTSKGNAEEYFSTAGYSSGDGRFGILYRPVLSHTLVVYKRDDPTSSTAWRVWQRRIVEMPNRAPVFSLEVSRGLLTTRKTEINFNKGMLAGVKIDKQSEVKAVSEVFVYIAEAIVQIPAKALILSKTEAQNQADLIRVNQQLLLTYKQLKDAQEEQANLNSGLNPDGTPRSNVVRAALTTSALRDCIRYAELGNLDDPGAYCQAQAAQH
ncbi:hypothetical protein B5K11_26290 [Rhizobium leguminosarum bv. trifolii]|uniref:hypothetical protein n=1 Tax=Rhizobium leguminosarum TaxID=384 RepID=UPI000E2FBD0E|nr:hypothetical protein [Rhizobium leguminosarum]RFB87657.1 hypothetical protein B5K11_26290 [Rhizobium leguminosarum bv. trifolii]